MLRAFLRNGGTLSLIALAAGLIILGIDWLLVLDEPGERIAESVVADIGGAVLVLTGGLIGGFVIAQMRDAHRFQTHGTPTDAVVDEVRLSFFGTDIRLHYTDAEGQVHRARLAGSNLAARPDFGPGTKLPIRIDPADPGKLRFQDALDRLAPQA